MDDFANAIAYEVKLEIANRYFGFRTGIEAEIGQYLEKLHETKRDQLGAVRLDLRRMRILLHTEQLFKDFLQLFGLPQDFGRDNALPELSAESLFAEFKGEGLCRSWRYRDLAFKVYRTLGNHIAAYREICLDLGDEYTEICTRIDAFHRNNDLTGILQFLRTFDAGDSERLKFLHAVSSSSPENPGKNLDQDLRIAHPRRVTDILPALPPLPSLKDGKASLNVLLKSAYSQHNPHSILPF